MWFPGSGQLPVQSSKAPSGGVGTSYAELPGAPADDRYPGTKAGFGEGCSIALAALTSGYHSERVHAGASGECAADGRNGLRDAHVDGNRAAGRVGLSRNNRRS